MFLNATYCISGSAESNVTSGGAIFLQRFLTTSVLVISSICCSIIWKEKRWEKIVIMVDVERLTDRNTLQTMRWCRLINQSFTFTAESTTAQLACCSRGVTRSTMFSASRASAALYLESASNIKTWPHLRNYRLQVK